MKDCKCCKLLLQEKTHLMLPNDDVIYVGYCTIFIYIYISPIFYDIYDDINRI